ncbi:L,D-transpeptidase [Nonomuraea sp. CA-141351]|uniref:L,D-transpeptidase n=1 Tax=Nonomuraea sp. CA-141351 TaxID=3239996 RepID=UPI003D8A596A
MRNGGTIFVSTFTVVLLLAAGCSSGGSNTPPEKQQERGPVAKLSITPADGTKKVAPDTGIGVKVTDGKVTKVTVADAKGNEVSGSAGADGTWRPRWPLKPSTAYTVSAQATGTDGKQVTAQAKFTTLKPKRVLETSMSPANGEKVGVGMPVQLRLSQPVTEQNDRAAVERSLEVQMSKPVEGAWSWVSNREVMFRPREYWPAGEKVTVVAHLSGLRAGRNLWGTKDHNLTFTVGPEHITKIRNSTHQAVVRKNGKVVKTIPISLGKPGDESYSGIMIAQEKAADVLMDSATIGRPGEYYAHTKWNVRMTYSGTYFHAAPWSTDAQGSRNVTHGCVNASSANARWFYKFTQLGDIIEIRGTKRKLQFGNGPTPWAKSWEEWVAGSALNKSINA